MGFKFLVFNFYFFGYRVGGEVNCLNCFSFLGFLGVFGFELFVRFLCRFFLFVFCLMKVFCRGKSLKIIGLCGYLGFF